MKMITKVFLIIAILLICLIAWAPFLGDGGIIQNAWNGIATSVNDTWIALTGASDGIVPAWNADGNTNLGEAQGNLGLGTGGEVTGGGGGAGAPGAGGGAG